MQLEEAEIICLPTHVSLKGSQTLMIVISDTDVVVLLWQVC